MGYILIWIESLATALLFVALFTALSGRLKKRLWQIVWPIMAALLPFLILLPATVFGYFLRQYHVAPTWLFGYTLSLTLFYLFGVIFFFYYGLARGGNAPASNTWSRSKLAIAFTVTSTLSFITVIFLASAMRVKLDAVQTNARTLVLSCLPARVPDHKNATPLVSKYQTGLITVVNQTLIPQQRR